MKILGLRSITVKKYNHAGVSKTDNTKEYPNILGQNFNADKPGQKWVGDITYIYTKETGWTYLAIVMDLFDLKAIDQVKEIIKDNIINFEYKTKNNRTFSVISLTKDINDMEKSLIKGQLNNNIYHIEISNNVDGKNVIEIHLKTPLDNDLKK